MRGVIRTLALAIGLAAVVVAPLPALAQNKPLTDVKGGRDHPLVKRYAGSKLIGYETKAFDEFELPTGPLVEVPGTTERKPAASEHLEGRWTRLLYAVAEERSSLEVFRNYEKALAEAGFTTLFTCAKDACLHDGAMGHHLYLERHPANVADTYLVYDAFTGSSEERYLSAVLERPNGKVYVSLLVAKSFGYEHRANLRGPAVLLDILETGAMEERMVTVDAGTMAKEIASKGSVSLYGIYFDFDKAVVKPESAPAIEEIAKLLKGDPSLKLYVVGHTDNQGGLDYNLNLSRKRAVAVVDELVKKQGVAGARLAPAGVGMLAPKAPNDSEEGRAQNRRVELVRQ